MARRHVVEENQAARIAAELAVSEARIREAVGAGQQARVADNTAPRWRR